MSVQKQALLILFQQQLVGMLAVDIDQKGSQFTHLGSRVDNHLSVSTLHGNAAVISSQEAYERLCAGQFSWRDVPMFNYLSPRQVRVTDCKLEYMTDSKGFHQPVYLFTLSDENDAALRGGTGWTTFVPALAG